jgi:hypothetical protein
VFAGAAVAIAGPHLEAGQRWEYEGSPKEYGGVLTIVSTDGSTAVVAVRYFFEQPSRIVQFELSASALEHALEKPADPEHEMPPEVQSPFPCGVFNLVECLQARHNLATVD